MILLYEKGSQEMAKKHAYQKGSKAKQKVRPKHQQAETKL